jgi:hypothetical protein
MTSVTNSEEYKEEYKKVQSLIQDLLGVVKYYGKEDWKSLTLLDRGDLARKIYKEITGKKVWED